MIETTNRPFPEAFADWRRSAGVTSRQLAERTGSLDPANKALSHCDLARLASNDGPLNPHAIKLVAVALDELGRPEYLVEYPAAQFRHALDRQSGDAL
jgi:transcriptional regulator with XRE-family HTH domain